MSKQKLNEFVARTKSFFYREVDGTRQPNMMNIYAVLIAGLVGWIFLTVTFGAKLKRTLKKVPLIGGLFGKKAVRRAPMRKAPARRTTRARRK
jgi:hypothetical protein